MQAVIFTGIPAAGKSTFYQRRFSRTHVRINLDMLKTRHRERLLVEACLTTGQPFVVDNTNLTAADRSDYIDRALAHRFEVIGYYFRSQAAESLARNVMRPPEEQVPRRGLLGACGRLEIPAWDEGYTQLWYVRIVAGKQIIQSWQED